MSGDVGAEVAAVCGDDGGRSIGAGHVCKCNRPAGHALDSERPHGCECGAPWGVRYCTPMWGSCALLSGHVGPHHGYPENIEAVIAVRVEAAKAEAVASMAALFRDIRADHITPYEAAALCDLRADSYRAAALDPGPRP